MTRSQLLRSSGSEEGRTPKGCEASDGFEPSAVANYRLALPFWLKAKFAELRLRVVTAVLHMGDDLSPLIHNGRKGVSRVLLHSL